MRGKEEINDYSGYIMPARRTGDCNRCGTELRHIKENHWKCPCCGNIATYNSSDDSFYFQESYKPFDFLAG